MWIWIVVMCLVVCVGVGVMGVVVNIGSVLRSER